MKPVYCKKCHQEIIPHPNLKDGDICINCQKKLPKKVKNF